MARLNAEVDEATRRAERGQLVRVHRYVARVPAAGRRVRRAVLQEVPRHPVILAAAGEVLDRFAPVAAVQLRASFTGRSDELGNRRCRDYARPAEQRLVVIGPVFRRLVDV